MRLLGQSWMKLEAKKSKFCVRSVSSSTQSLSWLSLLSSLTVGSLHHSTMRLLMFFSASNFYLIFGFLATRWMAKTSFKTGFHQNFQRFRIAQIVFGIENPWIKLWKIIASLMTDQWYTMVYLTPSIFIFVYWAFAVVIFSFNFIPQMKKFKTQPEKELDVKKCLKVSVIDALGAFIDNSQIFRLL